MSGAETGGAVQKHKFDTAIIVITFGMVNVTALTRTGIRISEDYGKSPDGELEHFSGNFEDEPSLPDGLMEALTSLQGPALAVLEELAASSAEVA
jgi:hypothetical protein